MSNIIYSSTNYRKNLELYWQQYYPNWSIPDGFHVHHIMPRKAAEKLGWTEEQINHPKNLIALHYDDHVSIHKNRGDHGFGYNYTPDTPEIKAKKSIGMINKHKKDPTLSKRKSISLKNMYANGELSRIGTNQPRWLGWYVTPWGKFYSPETASIQNVSPSTIRKYCKTRNDHLITERNYSHSKFLQSIGKKCIGKTPKQLGFFFIQTK